MPRQGVGTFVNLTVQMLSNQCGVPEEWTPKIALLLSFKFESRMRAPTMSMNRFEDPWPVKPGS